MQLTTSPTNSYHSVASSPAQHDDGDSDQSAVRGVERAGRRFAARPDGAVRRDGLVPHRLGHGDAHRAPVPRALQESREAEPADRSLPCAAAPTASCPAPCAVCHVPYVVCRAPWPCVERRA